MKLGAGFYGLKLIDSLKMQPKLNREKKEVICSWRHIERLKLDNFLAISKPSK